jgi:uncharacterized protein (DUF1810 family)
MPNLERFLKEQEDDYERALKEIKNGRKESCWMWYIFPQIIGLGSTQMSKIYAIKDIEEAIEYLNHRILGARLIEITQAVIDLGDADINKVFHFPDNLKLKSCMTLFREAEKSSEVKSNNVFQRVIDQFFDGKDDEKTLAILQMQENYKKSRIKQEENENLLTNKTNKEKEIDDKSSDDEIGNKDTTYNKEHEKQEIPENTNNNMENNETLTQECSKKKGENKEIPSITLKEDENQPIVEDQNNNSKEIPEKKGKCCPNCIII